MGMSDLEKKIAGHAEEAEIKAAFQAVVDSDAPRIAMVDSDKGTTNFNASNDVIIDGNVVFENKRCFITCGCQCYGVLSWF